MASNAAQFLDEKTMQVFTKNPDGSKNYLGGLGNVTGQTMNNAFGYTGGSSQQNNMSSLYSNMYNFPGMSGFGGNVYGGYAGATTVPTYNISKSSSRNDIKDFQNYYNQTYGGKLVVDGILGPKTSAAYSDYNTRNSQQLAQQNAMQMLNGFGGMPFGGIPAPTFSEDSARAQAEAMYKGDYEAGVKSINSNRERAKAALSDEMSRRGMGQSSLFTEQFENIDKEYDEMLAAAESQYNSAISGYIADLMSQYQANMMNTQMFNAQMGLQYGQAGYDMYSKEREWQYAMQQAQLAQQQAMAKSGGGSSSSKKSSASLSMQDYIMTNQIVDKLMTQANKDPIRALSMAYNIYGNYTPYGELNNKPDVKNAVFEALASQAQAKGK